MGRGGVLSFIPQSPPRLSRTLELLKDLPQPSGGAPAEEAVALSRAFFGPDEAHPVTSRWGVTD